MNAPRELPSFRFSLITLAIYALVLGGGLVAVKLNTPPPGLIPRGQWTSSTSHGDTTTTRLIEFPWGSQGIWTMHESVGQKQLRGDYRMFTLEPMGLRQYCLRVASESDGCLRLYWATDSVVITRQSDTTRWTFHAVPR